MREIVPNIYHTSVLNPNMRIFDVIMYTEYGTSYNSYIVKGSEKTALIEGAHESFLENFEDNVKDVIGDGKIDYLVLNHTEPDHTGCIAQFLEIYPEIEIIASPAAGMYIKNITNRTDLKIKIVKNGDSVSLGDKTLEFINAPFLHWPDSMFTWVPEDGVLFSCDFLGAHYCEPQMYDYRVVYPDKYWESVKYYYECIFAPFAPHVINGLDKIKDLDIKFVCNSHGPILTKDHALPKVMELYREWATPVKREHKLIPIFYCTAYGNTQRLGEKAKEGILKVFPDAEVELYNIIEYDMGDLHALMNESDAFLLGTLTINREVVPPISDLISGADTVNIPNRPVALFGSFGWSGEAFPHVANRLKDLKLNVYEEHYKINFVPSEEQLAGAVDFGESFANTLK